MPRLRQYAVYPYEAEFGFSPGFYGPGAKGWEVKGPALAATGRKRGRGLSAEEEQLFKVVEGKYAADDRRRLLLMLGIPVSALIVFGAVAVLSIRGKKPAAGTSGMGQLIDLGLGKPLKAMEDTVGKTASAAIALGTGTVIIVGSALLPKELPASVWIKFGGIALGAWVAANGALHAFAPPSGPPPEAKAISAAKDIVVSGKATWSGGILGFGKKATYTINIQNTTEPPRPLNLEIGGQGFFGALDTGVVEVTWPATWMALAPGEMKSQGFEFDPAKVSAQPGARSVRLFIRDTSTGRLLSLPTPTGAYEATFDFAKL